MNNPAKMLRHRQRGFTMIEILVAALVLSIGLLGLAGLQATGIRNNHSAYLRTQATILAQDAADSLRSNNPIGGVATLLDADNARFEQQAAALLPGGSLTVTPLGGNLHNITISWDDSRGEKDKQNFVLEVQL